MLTRAFLLMASSLLLLGGCDVPAAPSAAGLSQSQLDEDDDVDFGLAGPYETIGQP